MNKNLVTYLFLLLAAFGWQGSFSQTDKLKDTLAVDTSEIEPRHFEDLRDKYQGEDYIYEYSTENSGWWTRFKQWFNDFIRSLFDLETRQEANEITDVLMKIGGVIIFLLVIYFIFKAVMNDEGTWVFGKSSDKNIIPVTDIEQNLNITDFNKLTKDAEKKGEFRLAVRYYYLWLLKKLSQAEIIEYDVEKTNSDYQNEITSKNLKDDFSYTSYLYNYIWYGEFDVNEQQFEKAKDAFNDLLNTIKA